METEVARFHRRRTRRIRAWIALPLAIFLVLASTLSLPFVLFAAVGRTLSDVSSPEAAAALKTAGALLAALAVGAGGVILGVWALRRLTSSSSRQDQFDTGGKVLPYRRAVSRRRAS
jgi:hypothetical protein